MTSFQTHQVAFAILGVALGGLSAVVWHTTRAILGQGDFWHRFAAVVKSLFSEGAEGDFLRGYFRLFRSLARYVGTNLLALGAALLPVFIVLTFVPQLGPLFFASLVVGSVAGLLLFRMKRH